MLCFKGTNSTFSSLRKIEMSIMWNAMQVTEICGRKLWGHNFVFDQKC